MKKWLEKLIPVNQSAMAGSPAFYLCQPVHPDLIQQEALNVQIDLLMLLPGTMSRILTHWGTGAVSSEGSNRWQGSAWAGEWLGGIDTSQQPCGQTQEAGKLDNSRNF